MKPRFIFAAAAVLWAAGAAAATPPPIYDFCDSVVAVVFDELGHAADAGDTCDGFNLVIDHACGEFASHNGCEDYYAIVVPTAHSFTAMVVPTGDAALMVTSECIVYGTTFTCLANADESGPGGYESVTYGNWGDDRTVYLVVDSHTAAGCGAYTLELSIQIEVAAERASFGGIKAAYR